jgi:hypothetical protein
MIRRRGEDLLSDLLIGGVMKSFQSALDATRMVHPKVIRSSPSRR